MWIFMHEISHKTSTNMNNFVKACRVRWGTVDTFLYFQPLLLYFKSKEAQSLLHNKATLYTQYHAKT